MFHQVFICDEPVEAVLDDKYLKCSGATDDLKPDPEEIEEKPGPLEIQTDHVEVLTQLVKTLGKDVKTEVKLEPLLNFEDRPSTVLKDLFLPSVDKMIRRKYYVCLKKEEIHLRNQNLHSTSDYLKPFKLENTQSSMIDEFQQRLSDVDNVHSELLQSQDTNVILRRDEVNQMFHDDTKAEESLNSPKDTFRSEEKQNDYSSTIKAYPMKMKIINVSMESELIVPDKIRCPNEAVSLMQEDNISEDEESDGNRSEGYEEFLDHVKPKAQVPDQLSSGQNSLESSNSDPEILTSDHLTNDQNNVESYNCDQEAKVPGHQADDHNKVEPYNCEVEAPDDQSNNMESSTCDISESEQIKKNAFGSPIEFGHKIKTINQNSERQRRSTVTKTYKDIKILLQDKTTNKIRETVIKNNDKKITTLLNERKNHVVKLNETNVNDKGRLFSCDICNKGFNRKSHLTDHYNLHNNIIFKCLACDKVYSSKSAVLLHIKKNPECSVNENVDLQKFEIVKKTVEEISNNDQSKFDSLKNTVEELSSDDEHGKMLFDKDLYVCNKCKKCFDGEENLKNHSRYTMCGGYKRSARYQCEFCSRIYSKLAYLNDHINSHTNNRPYKCSDCDLSFSSKANFQNHQRINHGNGTFPKFLCCYCGLTHSSRTHMLAHEQTHLLPEEMVPKPFSCTVCGKKFISQFEKTHHKREHKLKKCPHCEQSFKIGNLRNHLAKVHNIFKEYKCEDCGKIFNCPKRLRSHKKSHSDVLKFFCDTCEKGFKMKAHLEQHMITHSDARPIMCLQCGESFKRKTHLKQHVAAYHKEEKEKRYKKSNKKHN